MSKISRLSKSFKKEVISAGKRRKIKTKSIQVKQSFRTSFAFALFIRGSMVVAFGLVDFFHSFSSGAEEYEKLLAAFVSSVDIFLFAMVLVIFGMGIYELFINKIDPVERKADSRPSWLQIQSIDELKSSLGKVILMVLIVSFFKHSLDISFSSASDLLYLSVGILLVASALYIANKQHK